jgi:cysteine desulfuration protein SufE
MSAPNSIPERQQEVLEELGFFQGLDLYDELLAQAKFVEIIEAEKKTDDRLVKGCQSRVWLDGEMKNGLVHFTGDSDAFISKGMLGLLMRLYNDAPPRELLATSLDFLGATGLKSQLTMQRAGGLASIHDQMKRYALAFSSQAKP